MTDSMFEQSLDRQIRAYADGGVQPFDRYAIAEDLIKSGDPSSKVLCGFRLWVGRSCRRRWRSS